MVYTPFSRPKSGNGNFKNFGSISTQELGFTVPQPFLGGWKYLDGGARRCWPCGRPLWKNICSPFYLYLSSNCVKWRPASSLSIKCRQKAMCLFVMLFYMSSQGHKAIRLPIIAPLYGRMIALPVAPLSPSIAQPLYAHVLYVLVDAYIPGCHGLA